MDLSALSKQQLQDIHQRLYNAERHARHSTPSARQLGPLRSTDKWDKSKLRENIQELRDVASIRARTATKAPNYKTIAIGVLLCIVVVVAVLIFTVFTTPFMCI